MKKQKITVPHSVVSESDFILTLDFLTRDELQTAKKCNEDMQDIAQCTERIRKFSCDTRENFKKVKNEIQKYSQWGYSLLLHIHGHGDKEKGIKLPSDNNYISWEEFIDFFSKIKSKEGNLTVIMSCCFSYTIVDLIFKSEKLPLPVAFFYGYKDEVSSGTVEDETKIINKSFLEDGGKSLMEQKNLYIQRFSEYDYMNYIISIILSKLNIGKLRENVVLSMPKKAASFSRQWFNCNYRDNPMCIIRELAEDIIQNPERRKVYLDCLENNLS